MKEAILVFLIFVSISLIVLILLQQRGSGTSAVFGGGGGGEAYRSRRGVEKIFHYLTIVLATFFSLVSFGLIFVK